MIFLTESKYKIRLIYARFSELEVGGYLTRCALPRRSLKLIIITQSVRNVSLELKSNLEITEIREGEQDDAP